MRVSYKIGSEDVAAFNLQHLRGLPNIRRKQVKGRAVLSLVYGLTAIGLLIYEWGYWPFAWLLMFFAILWYIFYPKVWEQRVRRKILKVFKQKKYEVNELDCGPDGIFVRSGERKGHIPWIRVKKVVQTEQHLFMYLTDEDGIIIPRAGLEEEFNWEELCGYVNLNWVDNRQISSLS